MRKIFALGMLTMIGASMVGCARPNEIGWTPAYTTGERLNAIARNWDMEGKYMQDDIDHILMLRPITQMSDWHVR